MGKIYYQTSDGVVLAVERGDEFPPFSQPSGAESIDISAVDNADLFQSLLDDPSHFVITGGVLLRDGQTQTINPDLTRQRAIAAAFSKVTSSSDEWAVAILAMNRYALTLVNDIRQHLGLSRITEAEHLLGIQAAVASGAGDPIV